jgi:hypothetical protein
MSRQDFNKSEDYLLTSLTSEFFRVNEEDFKYLRPSVKPIPNYLSESGAFSEKQSSKNHEITKISSSIQHESENPDPNPKASQRKNVETFSNYSNSNYFREPFTKTTENPDFHDSSVHESYEVQGEFLIHFVQNTLKNDYLMTEYFLPDEEKYRESPKCNIFISENFSNPSALLVLIQGAGEVRAGIWSRSVCLKDNMDLGSMIPFVEFAKSQNWLTLIMNPNFTHSPNTYTAIPLLETRENHGQYVWRKFIQTNSLPLYLVAHSCGGLSVTDLLQHFPEDFKTRVKKIAFTDAIVSDYSLSFKQRLLLAKKSIHWVASSRAGNSVISKVSQNIEERSAGHTKHEYATGSSFEYIIDYFLEN